MEAFVSGFPPSHADALGPGLLLCDCKDAKEGRLGWLFLCLPQMASACVDKDSITNV